MLRAHPWRVVGPYVAIPVPVGRSTTFAVAVADAAEPGGVMHLSAPPSMRRSTRIPGVKPVTHDSELWIAGSDPMVVTTPPGGPNTGLARRATDDPWLRGERRSRVLALDPHAPQPPRERR